MTVFDLHKKMHAKFGARLVVFKSTQKLPQNILEASMLLNN